MDWNVERLEAEKQEAIQVQPCGDSDLKSRYIQSGNECFHQALCEGPGMERYLRQFPRVSLYLGITDPWVNNNHNGVVSALGSGAVWTVLEEQKGDEFKSGLLGKAYLKRDLEAWDLKNGWRVSWVKGDGGGRKVGENRVHLGTGAGHCA